MKNYTLIMYINIIFSDTDSDLHACQWKIEPDLV